MNDKMLKNKETPWGFSQQAYAIGAGLIKYSTAGHGGMFVPAEMLAEMPGGLRCNVYAGGGSWFEEDCEASLVRLAFPARFSAYAVFGATDYILRSENKPDATYHAAYKWLQDTPAGAELVRLHAQYLQAHGDKYHLGGMSSCPDGWECAGYTLDGTKMIRFETREYPRIPVPFTVGDLEMFGAQITERKTLAA